MERNESKNVIDALSCSIFLSSHKIFYRRFGHHRGSQCKDKYRQSHRLKSLGTYFINQPNPKIGGLFFKSCQQKLYLVLLVIFHPVKEPNSSLSKSNSHVKLLYLTNAARCYYCRVVFRFLP